MMDFSKINPPAMGSLFLFQFFTDFWRDTVNKIAEIVQFAFQRCPFHAVFHLALLTGLCPCFQLFIFR